MGVFLFLGRQLLPLSRKVGLIGVTLVLIPIMCVGIYMLAPEEILDQRVGKTSTIYARLATWQLLLQEVVKEPIIGFGFNNSRDFLASHSLQFEGVNSIRHAHNTYLAFLYELGVVGLFAYLAVVVSIARTGLKLYREGHFPRIDGLVSLLLPLWLPISYQPFLAPHCTLQSSAISMYTLL